MEKKIKEKPAIPVRKLDLQTNIHCNHTLKRLKVQAYRATLLQELKARDPAHRLITKGLWPPCNPDLSPSDFF